MYGVPSNLDLRRFCGATLTQLGIGEFQLQFHFTQPEFSISVEGDWQVNNPEGEIVDRSLPNAERESFRVHRLLGRTVVESSVNAPKSFALRFDNGWSLVVFDNSQEYQSFSIQPGDIFV
jgi:hypothetical protein